MINLCKNDNLIQNLVNFYCISISFALRFRGSTIQKADVAQLVEQLIRNQ